ncbi:IS66 family transposase [Deinococcus sp.]|uniref:IS66 family transposase n=1 Tax=Deinococcus sp. TaxID=47478 RepID=UPI0025BA0751|nr:IS66 family transposase [Deinococcus sp.]
MTETPTVTELMDTIRQLQSQVQQLTQRVQELEAENKALREENTRLKKRISDLERKKNKYVAPQKPGRKSGQGQFTRKDAPDFVTNEVDVELPNLCPACNFTGELTLSHFEKASVTELPVLPRVEVTVYNVPIVLCPKCGKKIRGEHPDLQAGQWGATAHRIGPRLEATIHTIRHEVAVSERKLPRVLELLLGLRLTQSAISQAASRLAGDGSPLANHVLELEKQLRQAGYIHHDDTGWRIGGEQAWVGAYRSTDVALFKVNPQHTSAELRAVLGDEFQGTLVCDRYSVYDAKQFAGMSQQKCLAHVVRNISDVAAQVKGRAGQGLAYLMRLKENVQDALKVHRDFQQGKTTERQFRYRGRLVKGRIHRLLSRTDLRTPESERLRAGLWKQQEKGRLLHFLEKPEIPPTNNAAERQLRRVVITRKVSQCSKNKRGAEAHMRIKSVVETARLRGQDPVEVLASLSR